MTFADPIEYLEQLRPGGPWLLTAIDPDTGKITTATVATATDVIAFIDKWRDKRNLYYSVNPAAKALKKKAAKDDIAAIEYIQADLDPRPDETPEQAKARYLAALEAYGKKATALVDSGNGLQALFKLAAPVELNGHDRAAKLADIEARALALTLALGGPAGTQNIDRIFRLPGTINFPTPAKKAKGRTQCPTALLHFNGVAYSLDDLAPPAPGAAPAAEPTRARAEGAATGDIKPGDPRLRSLDPKWVALGHDGVGIAEDYSGDRSRAVMAFTVECFRAGIAQDVIEACLTHWQIGAHIREQNNVKRALARTITRAREFFHISKLFDMNEKHCVLPIGGKARVTTWGEDPEFAGRKVITMRSSLDDFKAIHNKYRHTIQTDDGEKQVKLGTWWINHPHRRQYDGGMKFMPTREEDVVGNVLNLWQGFAIQARKPEGKSGAAGCKLFLDHGLHVICSGDQAHYDYLIKREAFIAQKRTRSEIATAFQTEAEGTGKGMWERWLNHLYGPQHAMEVQNVEHVIGKFNPHLEHLLRITADEALFAGDPRHRNALYNLITEPRITIERKFVDAYAAANYLNIGIISNARHFIPVSGTARRLFVPKVSSDRMGDHDYFAKIIQQMGDEGGAEALLYHLLYEVDIRGWNVRDVPKTAILAEQAAYSRRGVDLLVEVACSEAVVPCQHETLPNISICSQYKNEHFFECDGFDHFINHHSDQQLRSLGALRVKRELAKEWGPGFITGDHARSSMNGQQRRGIMWPPLSDLRSKFEDKYGKQTWLDPDATEWRATQAPPKADTTGHGF